MDYARIKNGVVDDVIVADEVFVAQIAAEWDAIVPAAGGCGPGWAWTAQGGFVAPTVAPVEQQVAPEWEWYIDLGPFYDRFGAAKMPVLLSADAGVKAIIADLNIRKWVDLGRADVAQALAYVGSKVPEVTPALQTAILTTPVSPAENRALRVSYFPGVA